MNPRRLESARRARFGRGARRGFTVVEVLIATSITAVVMLGLCAAVQATLHAGRVNNAAIESAGRARLALGQMERAVRRSSAVVLTSASRLDVVDESNNATAYVYDAAARRLDYVMDGPVKATVTLARGVSAVEFKPQVEPDPETKVNRIVRIALSLTIEQAGTSHRFETSVAPRRSRTYQ